ncbi:MAG: 2-hydroxychromene-2-carboxylate isomerase [Proteobacteria bacterium]|nr:2-hydroxychromene-2-carboxylate isomerase [Pseudomonadota bacterium]
MASPIEYFFALPSPWCYLGHQRLIDTAAKAGRKIHFKPCITGKLFPAAGTLALCDRPRARKTYRMAELKRWRDHLAMPLTLEPAYFPVDESVAARTVIVLQERGLDCGALAGAYMRAVWAEEQDISDPAVIDEIAAAQGHDGPGLREAAEDRAVGERYEEFTEQAVAASVFGYPTFIVEGEMFWGQDRLDFVERALKG